MRGQENGLVRHIHSTFQAVVRRWDVLDASTELCLCTWMSRGLKKADHGDRRERMG